MQTNKGETMKHTTGNWRSFTDNANGFGVTNGNTVIAIAGETDLKENEANANLIAAAPELLEGCKFGLERMEAELERCGGVSGYLEPRIEKVKQAVAKAENIHTDNNKQRGNNE